MSDKRKPSKRDALKRLLSAGTKKLKKVTNTDLDEAVTKTGEKSRGRMTRADGSTYALMGDDLLKKQGNIDKLKGASAGVIVGGAAGAGGTYLAMKGSDKKKAPKKKASKKPNKVLTPFQAAFKKAADAGQKTFTFKGKRYTTERTTEDPKVVRRAVNKKDGGWIQGASKKPGALKKQRGVPKDQKIPAAKLNAAAKKGGKLGQRARLAKTLRGFKHGGEVTHTRWENKWN